MAEYYPLLAKAVGSLPNSTPESRRVVYERARKALIGQLRTLHPPVPDEDIERESVALDRAVERLEAELANGGGPAPATPSASPPPEAAKPAPPPRSVAPKPASTLTSDVTSNGPGERRPPPLKTKLPKPPIKAKPPETPPPPRDMKPPEDAGALVDAPPPPAPVDEAGPFPPSAPAAVPPPPGPPDARRAKPVREPHRPIAPQPPVAKGPKRRIWIIPAGIGIVVILVALAAWKLRDRPEAVVRTIRPSDQQQADAGKIAERVGGAPSTSSDDKSDTAPEPPHAATPEATPSTAAPPAAQQQAQPPANNPAVPVAHRAALLVEAPEEPNKVKTYLGTVVWKLNNVSQGQNDAVGLAVEADIDLPDDKLKAVVTFEKNSDASLPASHTIKIRFAPETGSPTGDIKQISVPQMRPEANPSGEPLAGVTVPVVQNSFLVGLSPGNAETANTDLIKRLQWIDVPMLLDSGKIAKLTFEKSDSGQRDLNEAFDAWQKP